MYLRELLIRNNGPIRDLHVELAFDNEDRPIPHVIVGKNGAGKTNFLSLIADALMEGAADIFQDVLKLKGRGRNWFRVVGGSTVTYNQTSGYSILRFGHMDQTLFYRENSGNTSPSQVKGDVPPSLSEGVNWADDGKHGKNFEINEDTVRTIYPRGAYAFFPASRSEIPHWLNQAAIQHDEYDTSANYSTSLGKSMFIEHGIDDFAQWLLGVLTESRAEIGPMPNPENPSKIGLGIMDAEVYAQGQAALTSANSILRIIMDNPQSRFYWAGRRQPRKVGVAIGNQPVAAGLDSLSGGQASLLSVFGAVLRHGDIAGIQPAELDGIVVIDELDAHIHIDLQLSALPELIAFFPKVQFILSSQSPFFTLGMEKKFGDAGVRIIELPTGLTLTAEAYSEFENALDALRHTRVFEAEVSGRVQSGDTPVILLGGETDLPYFQTAAKLLGYGNLVDLFEWIGSPGKSGGGFNTGDPALTAAVSLFRSNPGFATKKIVVVYDCDANKPSEAFDNVNIIGIPTIAGRKATRGIENLLPDSALSGEFYPQKTVTGPYGEQKVIQEFDKAGLCQRLCGADAQAATFADFKPILEQISAILFPSGDQDEQDVEADTSAANTSGE